jgi:hypothetical protein
MESINHSLELFHDNGCGGRIFKTLVYDKAYLIKCENYGQSVNEFVAQSIIAAIGLPAPSAILIKISHEKIGKTGLESIPIDTFGAVEYVPGLKRVLDREVFLSGDDERMQRYCELIMLDSLLADEDGTVEIYETEDGRMILLDLGEAVISVPYLEPALRQEPDAVFVFPFCCKAASELVSVNTRIEQGKRSCHNRMEEYAKPDNRMIDNAAYSVIERMSRLDFRDARECFKDLEESYGVEICEGYKQLFKKLRNTCRLIMKYR